MGFFLQDLINGAEQAANNFFHPQQQNQKQAQVKNAVQYAPKMLAPQAQQQWAQQHVSQVPQAPKAIQPNYLRAANQVGSGVGNFLFNGTAKLTNQGLGVIENVGANALGGAQSMINHNHSGDQLINQVKQHVDQQLLAKNKGLFGAGGIYNSSDALHNAKPSDVLTKAGGTGLQALTETFTPAKGVGVLAKEAPLALKAAKGALTGLTAGTAYNAGNQLSNTGKIDPKQLAINAAIGGTIGAATPLAVHAGSAAINASKHAAAIQADNIARQAASKNIPANVEAHTVTQKPGTVLNPDLVAQHEQLGASGHANHIIVTKNADGSFTPATDVGAHQLAAYTNLGATHMPIKEVTPAQLRGVKQGGYVHIPGSEDNPLVREQAAQYKTPEEHINDLVNTIWDNNKKGNGVSVHQFEDTTPGQGGNSYTARRVSNNTPYYRAKFEETGRAPTKIGIKQDIIDYFNGKNNAMKYELHPDERHVHDLIQEHAAQSSVLDNMNPAVDTPKPVETSTPKSDTAYQGVGSVSGKATITGKTLDTMSKHLPKLSANNLANKEAVSTIQKVAANPNAPVTVYRATVGNGINKGDWVFLTKNEADRFTKTAMGTPKPGVKVVSQNAKASDINWTGKNLEFSYNPQSVVTPKAQASVAGVQNALTKGAKAGRQNLSEEAIKQVQGEHIVRNTQALQDSAVKSADSQGIDKTISDAYNALNTKHIGDKEVALAQQAIERADAAGRTQDAVNIHDMLSEHLTKQGQTIQAASLLYRLSPQGLLYKAMRDIKKAGTEVTPALEDKLRTLSEGIKSAKGQDAKDLAVAKFHKAVADNIPQGKLQGAVSVWKAGLLSGPITHAGNLLSNATFGGLKKISDAPAAAVDAGLSAFGKTKAGQKLGLTGDRTKTFTVRGIGSGTKQGIGTAKETLMTGIDRRNINGNKYDTHGELNFKNPVIQKIFGDTSNGVFRAMGAGDQPFYYAAAKNSLYDQALAAGKNQGLKGSKLTDFAKNTVANPSQKMAQQAQKDAQYAVLSQDSPVASAITGGLSRLSEKNPLLGAAGSVTVPFTKVPTNFLSETLDYTPVGPIKSILQSIKSAKAGQGIDQRALSEAIGKGATGTGIMVLGSALAGAGLLSGQYPTGDQKEVQRWKAEGIQPNSIKIGNNWISMNYLGPVGMLMQAGKDWNDAAARGDDKAIAALTGFGKSLTGQSFLTGFSGVANALQDPQRFGSNFINQQAGSIVPNWMNQTAQAIDPNQRQADTVPQSIQSRIPGLRQGLNVKQDVYGNPLQTRTDPANMLLNPLRPSNAVTSPTLGEVSRLHNTDVNNKDVQVTPTPVNATISLGNKQTVKLNKDQQYQLQKAVGQETQAQWGKLIQTPQYQAMTDTEKANALNTLRTNASEAATRQFVAKNSLGNYAKAPSAKVSALMNGNADVASLSAKSALGGLTINSKLDKSATDILSKYNAMSADQRKQYVASSNDAQFKLDDAKYKNDKISGKITPVQDVTRRAVLAKEQVGANFSPTVRNLYSLSKSNLATYLNQDPNAQNTVNQLLAYDQALVGAGISSKGKYASGVTTTSRSRSTSTRVRTSTGRATTTKAATKSAISALNKASKSTTSATSALNKKVASTKVTVTKARLPSGKAKGVKLTAYKKVAAAPKISMKRRT